MLQGHYYDGRSARRHVVMLDFANGRLRLSGDEIEREDALAAVDISEKLGRAPRIIRYADGAHCEVHDHEALEPFLESMGHREGLVDRWQRRWLPALASAVLVVAAAAAAYVWGLPWASARMAERLPAVVARTMSSQVLEALDSHILFPSKLAFDRQQKLTAMFEQLQTPGSVQVPHRLLFRAAPQLGPNAMALPDGTIVLLDELVAITDNDQQILAALAHELGHVRYRHGLDLLLRGAAVGTFMAWWLGDFSSLIAAAPAAVLQARHSREFEVQADAYAASLLRANGIEPARLAEMLEKLQRAHDRGDDKQNPVGSDYLSSHPATDQRIRALRDLR